MASKVLDASSFYAGIPFSSQEISFTTPLVLEEIKHIKKEQDVISTLIESNRLRIIEPEKKFTDAVLSKAKETGDLDLSKQDISVVALCLQLGGELVTDDFAVSNVAKHLNLKVTSAMTRGISKVLQWVYFCSGCQKTFSEIQYCPICGNKLKRKSSKRKLSSNPIGN